MSMRCLRAVLVASLALAGTQIGCGEIETTVVLELEVATGQPFAIDLRTDEVYRDGLDHRAEEDSLAGCRVTSYGLPEGARFDGPYLEWTPSGEQAGRLAIRLDYDKKCVLEVGTRQHMLLFEIKGRPFQGKEGDSTSSESTEWPEVDTQSQQVHDLE